MRRVLILSVLLAVPVAVGCGEDKSKTTNTSPPPKADGGKEGNTGGGIKENPRQ